MKLENQVCSIDLAKKLKELGVAQKSIWNWFPYYEFVNKEDKNPTQIYRLREGGIIGKGHYSAFTVAELGEMLPEQVYTIKGEGDFYCWSDIEWTNEEGLFDDHIDPIYADTEADARAKMLIYLIENKLINL